jgi:peptide-methionine (S)-S-oxide reductase
MIRELKGLTMLMLAGAITSMPVQAAQESAIFAGGCFWCVESDFDKVDGVIRTTSGYVGGHLKDPTYEQVSAGGTGHAEAVKIDYDPQRISYRQLVDHFWRTIDPTVKDQQFCDHGNQYRSAIFYLDDAQRQAAEESKESISHSKPFKQPIVTEIVQAGAFYPAEERHQDYYKKNPLRYKYYRYSCGRDQRVEELWGKR